MKTIRRFFLLNLLLTSMVFLLLNMSAAAAVRKNQWYTAKNGTMSYYDANGKLSKGKTKIDGKYYFFDTKGRQRVGWQKIGSDYYFFTIEKGKKAYMVTGKTVNGIKLGSNGKANKKNSTKKRKLKIMTAANKTVESLTKYSLQYSKRQKYRMCFNYTVKKYRCTNIGSFKRSSVWDLYYAERVILPKDKRYRADCYTYGCAMAYLANACGGKAAAVSSGGHGWAEVDGYVCDPNWSRVDRKHNYFMRSYKLVQAGTPSYRSARHYVKKI